MFRLVLSFALIGITTSAKYDYGNQAGWGGVCQTGKKQSPVAVTTPNKYQVLDKENVIQLPESTSKIAIVREADENTLKHSFKTNFKIKVPAMPNANVEGESFQFHIHWAANDKAGSEHTLNGEAFPLEMHLIFTYDSGKKLAVLGRFFKLGAKNAQIQQLIDQQKAEADGTTAVTIDEFNLLAIYPNSISKIVNYPGSLTTPGCDEKVHWVVIPEPLTVSTEQLQALRTLKLGSRGSLYSPVTTNYRAVQNLNGRTFVGYQSGSVGLAASTLALIVGVIATLF